MAIRGQGLTELGGIFACETGDVLERRARLQAASIGGEVLEAAWFQFETPRRKAVGNLLPERGLDTEREADRIPYAQQELRFGSAYVFPGASTGLCLPERCSSRCSQEWRHPLCHDEFSLRPRAPHQLGQPAQ